jgi:hypothetical protein
LNYFTGFNILMTTNKLSSTRLYVLLDREAPVAIVFRRGPSKQVLLLKCYTGQDIFEEGQWLKGRIYERQCALSPSGEKLIYFATDFKNLSTRGSLSVALHT